jgi:transposase
VQFRCTAGNTNDADTHRQTWDTLRAVAGRPDFLYVADSKLCTREAMDHIDRQRCGFVTVLPCQRSPHSDVMRTVLHPGGTVGVTADLIAKMEEDALMIFVGVDLHTREQTGAVLDTATGEIGQFRLRHEGNAVEAFYADLPGPATVAIESTGYALWFHSLMQRLGHTLLVGDAAKIRATVVRRTKTDRRDAKHILTLLKEGRFPAIWVPDPDVRDLRALVAHRMRLVRVRTMIRNGVHAIALNYRLTLGASLFTRRGVAQLQALSLPTYTAHRREESLELLSWLDARIATLEDRIAAVADANPDARRLMTHPGVGPLTALATLLVVGPISRFPTSKHVVSYVGLAPAIASSAGKHHLGGITKQGNRLVRFVLGQAGHTALRGDPDLKRLYYRVLQRRGKARAKVAVARALLVRLYIMQWDQIEYAEFRRRGEAKAA